MGRSGKPYPCAKVGVALGVRPTVSTQLPMNGNPAMDRVLSFTIPSRDARGRAVRLGPVLAQVLAAHDYPPVIRDLLAEALVLVALLGALLKDVDSQLTMQAQAEGGVVSLLVCDYRNGE